MENPFYVSQLPEGVQNKLKDMQKRKLLEEGYSEKDAEYYADEFLNEKIYTAEEFYGNNFWERPEFKEEPKSPGAKSQKDEDEKVEEVDTSTIDEKDSGKSEEDDLDLYMKDLNDYMDKNKKGRDDIPVTTRR